MRNQSTQEPIKRWIYLSKKLSNQTINQTVQQLSKQNKFSHPTNESTAASSKQCNYVRCSFLGVPSLPPFWLVYLSCLPSQMHLPDPIGHHRPGLTSWIASIHATNSKKKGIHVRVISAVESISFFWCIVFVSAYSTMITIIHHVDITYMSKYIYIYMYMYIY